MRRVTAVAMHDRRRLRIGCVCGVLLLNACSSATAPAVAGDAAAPPVDAASPPVTTGIVVTGLDARVAPGASVSLYASPATDGMSWSATCGVLSAPSAGSVVWTAPHETGACQVRAAVSGVSAEVSARVTWATALVARDTPGDEGTPGFDVEALYYGVAEGTLYLEATMARFDPDAARVEFFLRRTAADHVLHSLEWSEGATLFWSADRPVGHPHYHWQVADAPPSLELTATPTLLTARVALADVGLAGEAAAQVGLAGAPTWVMRSAEYTDRLPDGTEVTPTDIVELAEVTLR